MRESDKDSKCYSHPGGIGMLFRFMRSFKYSTFSANSSSVTSFLVDGPAGAVDPRDDVPGLATALGGRISV
jgi:hypothetical protein